MNHLRSYVSQAKVEIHSAIRQLEMALDELSIGPEDDPARGYASLAISYLTLARGRVQQLKDEVNRETSGR